MKPQLLLATLLLATTSVFAAPCAEPGLASVDAEHPACRYEAGMRLLRAGDLRAARTNWEQALASPATGTQAELAKDDARNQLGMLAFTGKTARQDRVKAAQLWEQASSHGHAEAALRLCHAWGDDAASEYAPASALVQCRLALQRYEQAPVKSKTTETIVEQLRELIKHLEPAVVDR